MQINSWIFGETEKKTNYRCTVDNQEVVEGKFYITELNIYNSRK